MDSNLDNNIIVLFTHCTVFYDGRAKSELKEGDRLIIIKPDGSFLVHKNEKREPVNWQPPGSVISWELKNECVLLKSVRRKPRELLEVKLLRVYHVCAFCCEDCEELSLTGSEAEMVDLIFENPGLIEDGFMPLYKEYQTTSGFIDVFGRDKDGNVVILELKRRRADLQAVSQLKRYVECLRVDFGDSIRGILVAPSMTSGAKKLLESEGLEFKVLKPVKKDKLGKNGKQITLLDTLD